MCVGKDAAGGAAWVVTRSGGGKKGKATATVWDPLTALRYGGGSDTLPLNRCPYLTVGSMFNHTTLCANLQVRSANTPSFLRLARREGYRTLCTVNEADEQDTQIRR